MKFNKLIINSFGKLQNFETELSDGLNIIYGENESGKTTLMSFIKMMLYGAGGGNGSDLSRYPRKKYSPWDGDKFEGAIEYTDDNGARFRLERAFGASNATDKITLWSLDSNEKIPLDSKQPGEQILGINGESFARTCFIASAGAFDGKEKEGELSAKLSNLATTGDESVSHKLVAARIEDAKTKIKSKSGKAGILDKLYMTRRDLEDELDGALKREKEKEEIAAECVALQNRTDACKIEIGRIVKQLEYAEKYEKYTEKKRYSALSEEINKLEAEHTKKSDKYASFGDEYISEIRDLFSDLKNLKDQYKEQQDRISSIKKKPAAAEKAVTKELIANAKALEDELATINSTVEMINTNSHSAQTAAALSAAELYKTACEKVEELEREVANLRKIVNANKIQNAERPPRINFPLLIFGGIVIVGSAVLAAVIKNSGFYYIIILGLIAAVLSMGEFFKKHSPTKPDEFDSNALRLSQQAYELEKAKAERALRDENLKNEEKNQQEEAERLSLRLEEYSKEKEDVSRRLSLILKSHGCKSSDELVQLHISQKTSESDAAALENAEKESLSRLNQSFAQRQELLFKRLSDYKEVSSLEQARSVYEELVTARKEITRLANKIQSKKEALSDLAGNEAAQTEPVEDMAPPSEDISETKRRYQEIDTELRKTNEKLIALETGLDLKYQGFREVAAIEVLIKECDEKIRFLEERWESLNIASNALEEAFSELRKSFGAILDDEASTYFSRLTGGKYEKLLINRDFEINARESSASPIREWQYLSGGTIDQAYLSLRLALVRLIGEGVALPVMLDDVFSQYDDGRTSRGFETLGEFAAQNQVVFFTCHKEIQRLAQPVSSFLKKLS